jgi:hypothetical protein
MHCVRLDDVGAVFDLTDWSTRPLAVRPPQLARRSSSSTLWKSASRSVNFTLAGGGLRCLPGPGIAFPSKSSVSSTIVRYATESSLVKPWSLKQTQYAEAYAWRVTNR